MERHQAQPILDHLDIVQHFAKGGMLDFVGHTHTGQEMKPDRVLKGIIINCLPNFCGSIAIFIHNFILGDNNDNQIASRHRLV